MSSFIIPYWPAPPGVAALVTTRLGGVSRGPWASLNLADHVGDDPQMVAENRSLLTRSLPTDPVWLRQVHGVRCIDASLATATAEADASFTRAKGKVCVVLTADCLPVMLCDRNATVVGIAHAGWRGLADGVIEATTAAMAEPAENLIAWLGPAIGSQSFEVGDEVREKFVAHDPKAIDAFVATGAGRWLCDIHKLAIQRLQGIGVTDVAASGLCTVLDRERFFSYRRDGVTGRMASCIWLKADM